MKLSKNRVTKAESNHVATSSNPMPKCPNQISHRSETPPVLKVVKFIPPRQILAKFTKKEQNYSKFYGPALLPQPLNDLLPGMKPRQTGRIDSARRGNAVRRRWRIFCREKLRAGFKTLVKYSIISYKRVK